MSQRSCSQHLHVADIVGLNQDDVQAGSPELEDLHRRSADVREAPATVRTAALRRTLMRP